MSQDIVDVSLEDFLAQAGQPQGFVEADGAFSITNDDEALWAMRRLAQAQRRIDAVKAQAQVEIDRINAWVEANTTDNKATVDYFDRILGDYLMTVRENEADGRKSLDFPDGTVSSRATQPKVAVEDLEAFLAWADANGHAEWVRVKREADIATIKKVVDLSDAGVVDPATGEVIEGLSFVEGGVSTTVKVND